MAATVKLASLVKEENISFTLTLALS